MSYSVQLGVPDELIVMLRDWLLDKGWGMYPVPAEAIGNFAVTYEIVRLHAVPEPWKSLYPETLMTSNEKAAKFGP
jgi:hypothetical protein